MKEMCCPGFSSLCLNRSRTLLRAIVCYLGRRACVDADTPGRVCVCVCVCPLLPVFLLLPFAYQKLNTSWRMTSLLILFSSIVVSIDRLSLILINGHAVDRLVTFHCSCHVM